MKIIFKDSELNKGIINVSLNGGFTYKDYEITDVKESGIPLEDSQDYEKIKIKGPANTLKRLDVITNIPSNSEASEGFNFIIDKDTYGFSFPECIVGITLPDGIKSITSISTGTYSKESVFSKYPNLHKILIPNSVTTIGDEAFKGCSGLTSITIPDGVTSMGNKTFYMCSSLTSVNIPSSVKSINQYAFQGCSSLTSVTIPCGMGTSAFSCCSSLTSVTLGNGVNSLGSFAFSSCPKLTNITIPSSVTSIGDYAFSGCSSLKTINYTGTDEQWNTISKGTSWNRGCPSNMKINYNYQG